MTSGPPYSPPAGDSPTLPPVILGNPAWVPEESIPTPVGGSAVTSVEGRTGAVDVLLPDIDGLQDALTAKADAAATTTALAGKANANHTQAISTVTGLQSALDAKAATTALTSGLAAKSDVGHGHAIADVSNLQSTLDAKATSAALVSLGPTGVPHDGKEAGASAQFSPPSTSNSVVLGRQTQVLQSWLDWLGSAKGYVTEIGFPSLATPKSPANVGQDASRWNPVAEAYLRICDDGDVGISQWLDTNDGSSNPNAMNAVPGWFTGPSTAIVAGTSPRFGPGSAPVLRHAKTSTLRGFQADSGMQGSTSSRIGFGAHAVDAANPGFVINDTVALPAQEFFDLLAAGGLGTVRVSFQWEALQASLNASLTQAGMDKLDTAIQRAVNAGLKVLLCCHNYAGYQFWRYGTTTATALGTAVGVGGNIPYNTADANLSYSGNAVLPTTGSFDIQFPTTGQIVSVHKSGSNLVIDAFYNGATSATWANGTAIRTYRYRLGDSILTGAHLADLWSKIATYYKQVGKATLYAGISGYELMNEPTAMPANLATLTTTVTATVANLTYGGTITVADTSTFPQSGKFGIWVNGTGVLVHVGSATTLIIDFGTVSVTSGQVLNSPQLVWESATQASVTAIRAVDTAVPILAAGYDFSSMSRWRRNHAAPWITDPNTNTRYVAHHYWSSSGNGDAAYDVTFAAEEANATFGSNSGGYYMVPDGNVFERLAGAANRLRPQTSQATLDRAFARDTLTIMANQTLYVTTFMGEVDQTVSTIALALAVASSADLTVARLCLVEIDSSKSMIVLATTAHDTTLFNSLTNGMTAAKALSGSVKLRRGRIYGVGALAVGGTTKPTLQGIKAIADYTRWPQLAYTKATQADLPAVGGFVTAPSSSAEAFYAVLA